MTKQYFGTSHVPLSPAVRAGDFVYVSGRVPVDGEGRIVEGGIGAQATKVLESGPRTSPGSTPPMPRSS